MKILQCVTAIAGFVSLSSAVTIAPTFPLYAYGHNISGLPLFLSHDMAYVGHANLIPSSLNVSLTLSNDGMLLVSANTTKPDTTLTSFASLYIVTADDSFKAVGIITSNSSVPTGGVTGPFTFYGNTIIYTDSLTNILSSFWAIETNQSGVWSLVWNVNGSAHDNSTPIVLKTVAPINL